MNASVGVGEGEGEGEADTRATGDEGKGLSPALLEINLHTFYPTDKTISFEFHLHVCNVPSKTTRQ